ncbi:TetR/AcrR family transcriptional regulator [Demequina capsici]|uniref:TetR/AcrR family transcriptional regulator n=1 Tax=Demequina capsici TaxID=3075620 RepID=A0AA96JGX7_9MICO|nr:TetR/AcrR family transcriptional regulator [Demequina sp. PMTSA13]WNM28379.1 TetR/AcrR family transcriptional regulator [Demequina sp. PMTSA13]
MTAASAPRAKLSRERIIDAAMELADRDGVESLTMRALATALDTKPMTLYHHVDGKEALLDLMVDRVFSEMELPPEELEWREALRARCRSAREVLVRHPWSVPLLESRRSPGPELLRHHEAMLATLERGGLPLELMAHGYAILDSFVYGFAIEEANLPGQGQQEGLAEVAEEIAHVLESGEYPQMTRLAMEHVAQPGYSFGASFDVGLDMILDGLTASLAASSG